MMNVRIFITLSFLMMFSEVPNHEIKESKTSNSNVVSNPTESNSIIKNPAAEALKVQIGNLEQQNKINSLQIELTKSIVKDFKKQANAIIKESSKEEKKLKSQISDNQRKIDSLKLELESKDALIVEQVYNSIKPDSAEITEKSDSLCVRWKFLTKRTPENCTKWIGY